MALGHHWRTAGRLKPSGEWQLPGRAEPLLVASGSCSPVTAGQISWARAQGFAEIALDPGIISGGTDIGRYLEPAVNYLSEGCSLILHTGETLSISAPAALLGTGLGRLVREIAQQLTGLRRLVIAGGDTSSYAARALGIEALEMICPLTPGAPLCLAHAPGSPVDGMEVNLKGGQVGGEDYFGKLLEGTN
jgi:uncharacterized protein YgbK (DUF1537 family)